MAGEYCNVPFELSCAPLFRARLFRLGEREHVLALAFHHIISDAWSQAVFINELKTLYGNFTGITDHKLPDLPFRYVDYAIWQRNFLSGNTLQGLENYWRNQLDGLTSQLQFSKSPAGRIPASTGPTSFEFFLTPWETEAIRKFSRNEGVTLFSALLAGFVMWIHEQTGAADISVGVPVANRSQNGLEQMLGIFVNILVLRTGVSGQLELREMAHRVQRSMEQGYIHQEMPLKRLYEMLRPEASRHLGRLFEVEFNFIKLPPSEPGFAGLAMENLDLAGEHEPGDLLHLYVRDQGDTIGFFAVYKRAVFSPADVEKFPCQYKRILKPALADSAEAHDMLAGAGVPAWSGRRM